MTVCQLGNAVDLFFMWFLFVVVYFIDVVVVVVVFVASFTVIQVRTVYKILPRLAYTRASPPAHERSDDDDDSHVYIFFELFVELELTIINSNIALFNSLCDLAGWLVGCFGCCSFFLFFTFLASYYAVC